MNIVLLITDGHGHFTGDMDWCTKEFYGLKHRMDKLRLTEKNYIKFNDVTSPAVSTIMSIESIMSGIYSAKTHKMHWRQWPQWDKFDHPVLSSFLKKYGYEVNGFSYLLNSENWLPSICCYKPEIYKNYPSIKRDTHSHEAVLAAIKDFFKNAFKKDSPQLLIVHTIFVFDIWEEMFREFSNSSITDENTIFVYTADHYFPENFGRQWLLGERDDSRVFHHIDLTENNIRVPLYLKYPGSQSKIIDESISGYDIVPTILDLLGCLSEWPAKFDGISLVPLLKNQHVERRMLRTDNLYPFQIGEKQGRITAIRNGKYKYVYRPDPPSSYISYRLNKSWNVVLNNEEFYDLEADPTENNNLINAVQEDIKSEISKCRNFLHKTDEDIISYHIESLKRVFRGNKQIEQIFNQKEKKDMLCIQSSHDMVFDAILSVLVSELPGWNIDVVVKKQHKKEIEGIRNVYKYPSEEIYQKEKFYKLFDSKINNHYDCILNTSNVPLGDYKSVYDEKYHPVGDFEESCKIIRYLDSDIKISLCLDMKYEKIKKKRISHKLQLISKKYFSMNAISSVLLYIASKLRFLKKYKAQENCKIDKHLSERIISS